MYDGKLKGVSFLPRIEGGAYKSMPYEEITAEQYEQMCQGLKKVDFSAAYLEGEEAVGEKYCSTDVCEIDIETAPPSEIDFTLVEIPTS
jgi:hypothetical protein